jgi:hypothetical protein
MLLMHLRITGIVLELIAFLESNPSQTALLTPLRRSKGWRRTGGRFYEFAERPGPETPIEILSLMLVRSMRGCDGLKMAAMGKLQRGPRGRKLVARAQNRDDFAAIFILHAASAFLRYCH